VVGRTFSPGFCGWAAGSALCAGAGVALLCGVGEGCAVGEAEGCGVAAPDGGGAFSFCCARIGAADAASRTSDDADNSSARLRWNDGRRYMKKFLTRYSK
jgi:hypothetical protein